MLVLDASAALAVILDEMDRREARQLLEEIRANGVLVPPLWTQEVVNALLMAERRDRITPSDVERGIALLDGLPVELTESDPPMSHLASVAREHRLTAYDATYLLTAMESGSPLARRDEALAEAARRAGVRVISFPR